MVNVEQHGGKTHFTITNCQLSEMSPLLGVPLRLDNHVQHLNYTAVAELAR